MKRSLLHFFPVLYALPFLLSTIQLDTVATINEVLRWLVLLLGVALLFDSRLQVSPRRILRLVPTDWVIWGSLLLFFLSSFWSIDSSYSFQRACSMALLLIVSFQTFWRYVDVYSERSLLGMMLGAIAVVMMFSLILSPVSFYQAQGARYSGFFVNPNNIGMIAGLAIPLAFSYWLQERTYWRLFCWLVPLVSLVAAGTRSSLVGTALALSLILVSNFGKRPLYSAITLVFIVSCAVTFSQTQYFDDHVLRLDSIETASNRTHFWSMAESYIANRPLLGHGFGADAFIHDYYGVKLRLQGLRGYGVMSSYYGMAVQLGWYFSLAFFGWLWFVAVRAVVFDIRRIETVTFGATIISGLTICFFEPAIYSAGNAFSFLFWVCMMLLVRRTTYQRCGIRVDNRGGLIEYSPASGESNRETATLRSTGF